MDIIKYMYNHEDSLALIVMVNDLIQATPTPTPARRRRGDTPAGAPDGAATKGRVRFKAFLKVLLDFQLKGHQRFLSKFHAQFSEVDTDANGVIDEGVCPTGWGWCRSPRWLWPAHLLLWVVSCVVGRCRRVPGPGAFDGPREDRCRPGHACEPCGPVRQPAHNILGVRVGALC